MFFFLLSDDTSIFQKNELERCVDRNSQEKLGRPTFRIVILNIPQTI